jgi:Tfp pilus assembly protein PilO
MENKLLKYLIIITLAYYLIKGLIYILLWQTTKRVEEHAREAKEREKKKLMQEKGIWEDEDDEQ